MPRAQFSSNPSVVAMQVVTRVWGWCRLSQVCHRAQSSTRAATHLTHDLSAPSGVSQQRTRCRMPAYRPRHQIRHDLRTVGRSADPDALMARAVQDGSPAERLF